MIPITVFGKEGDSLPILSYYDANTLPIKYFSFASWTGVEAKFLFDCPSPDDADAISPNSHAVEPKLSNSDELKKKLLMSRLPSIAPGPSVTVKLDLISMVYSGESTFHFQTEVRSWCLGSSSGMNKWPHDEYDCIIVIEPWEVHEKINIEEMDEKDRKMQFVSSTAVITPTYWNQLAKFLDNETHQSERYILSINLKRSATTYNIVFYTPLLVTFILMSFWSEPLESFREQFYAGCTILICLCLSGIDKLVPTDTVPSISKYLMSFWSEPLESFREQFYAGCTILICFDSVHHSNVRSAGSAAGPRVPHNTASQEALQDKEDDDEEATTSRHIEEMESEKDRAHGDVHELAEVSDKALFVVYSITFALMMALHY
ncbi:Cys-loop ligand-gated ion channel subunit-like protein [Operophtera brumata]|uniref:Cys-loop ligand-gated ion channel subunit-like protein n=1 Tax=Operophtera brumata TaxID=104452 RepID=A0A0L7LDD6_OPEBR|nr:Cys-loop ligand-gated ion channel subunit-like protein [Operophtera brumata]